MFYHKGQLSSLDDDIQNPLEFISIFLSRSNYEDEVTTYYDKFPIEGPV